MHWGEPCSVPPPDLPVNCFSSSLVAACAPPCGEGRALIGSVLRLIGGGWRQSAELLQVGLGKSALACACQSCWELGAGWVSVWHCSLLLPGCRVSQVPPSQLAHTPEATLSTCARPGGGLLCADLLLTAPVVEDGVGTGQRATSTRALSVLLCLASASPAWLRAWSPPTPPVPGKASRTPLNQLPPCSPMGPAGTDLAAAWWGTAGLTPCWRHPRSTQSLADRACAWHPLHHAGTQHP